MAPSSIHHKRRSYTVDEVVDAVFANDDSADKYMQSESSKSECESSESEEPVATPEPIRGNIVGRGPRATGDRSQSILWRAQIREAETRKLEERWKREDNPPVIPEFLDLVLDNNLYMYLTTQTNLYMTKYLEPHPDLLLHSHYRCWDRVSTTEMKEFLSLYLLNGIIKKPVIHQYWSTHPTLKTQLFNNTMPINCFQSILEFFHFNDNSQYSANDPNRDQLFKICLLVKDMTSRFKSVYTQTQPSIDR